MQIVIDISKETYTNIKAGALQRINTDELLMAVDSGTVLPKGHGRLIDADKLPSTWVYLGVSDTPKEMVSKDYIDKSTKTLVKADKE